jgi:hypothetical protein
MTVVASVFSIVVLLLILIFCLLEYIFEVSKPAPVIAHKPIAVLRFVFWPLRVTIWLCALLFNLSAFVRTALARAATPGLASGFIKEMWRCRRSLFEDYYACARCGTRLAISDVCHCKPVSVETAPPTRAGDS